MTPTMNKWEAHKGTIYQHREGDTTLHLADVIATHNPRGKPSPPEAYNYEMATLIAHLLNQHFAVTEQILLSNGTQPATNTMQDVVKSPPCASVTEVGSRLHITHLDGTSCKIPP